MSAFGDSSTDLLSRSLESVVISSADVVAGRRSPGSQRTNDVLKLLVLISRTICSHDELTSFDFLYQGL